MPIRIFICGAPRSGTTYLRELIGSHPDVHRHAPETGLFAPQGIPSLLNAINKGPAWERFRNHFWNHVYKKSLPWLDDAYNGVSTMKTKVFCEDALNELEDNYLDEIEFIPHIANFVDALLGTDPDGKPYKVWAEKTPMHCLHIDAIKTVFPSAKIVYIERDTKLVAKSIVKKPWGADNQTDAEVHVDNMKYIARRQIRPMRNMVSIKLEELVEDCGVLAPIFDFNPEGMIDVYEAWKRITNKEMAKGLDENGERRVC